MEITRERFVELWHNAGLDDVDLLAKGNLYETENFIFHFGDEEVSFIHKFSTTNFPNEYPCPYVFGWYKLDHIGRCVRCSVPTEEELIELLNLLKEELDEDEKV